MGNVSATRQKIHDILDGVGGVNVKIGMFYPEDSETDECFGIATTDVPTLVIHPGALEGIESFMQGSVDGRTKFSVMLSLYYAYTNHVDFDYMAMEDLFETLLHELVDMANWTGTNVSAPYDIEPFKKVGEHKASPRVIRAEATLRFYGVCVS